MYYIMHALNNLILIFSQIKILKNTLEKIHESRICLNNEGKENMPGKSGEPVIRGPVNRGRVNRSYFMNMLYCSYSMLLCIMICWRKTFWTNIGFRCISA